MSRITKEFLAELKGKTIQSCHDISAEYGRTYNNYLGLVFTDGSKKLLYVGDPYDPKVDIEEMKRHPNFFAPKEIADEVFRVETEKRKRNDEYLAWQKSELARLKRELGEA